MGGKLLITPKTRLFDLLEAYPCLVDTLIEFVPGLWKLRNPYLKNTVARVTSIRQAAAIGEVRTDILINRLRKDAGQDLWSGFDGYVFNRRKPGWFNQSQIVSEINVTGIINSGEQPVTKVVEAFKKLNKGGIIEVNVPFVPAPLIEKLASLSAGHWLVKRKDNSFSVYFCRL